MEKSSLGIVTALAPYLGYKESARIAKTALKENKSIEDIVLEENIMPKEKLEEILSKAVEETKKVF